MFDVYMFLLFCLLVMFICYYFGLFDFSGKRDKRLQLEKLMALYPKSCIDPLEGLNICTKGKKYLGENSEIVMGPTVDYEPTRGMGAVTWLCKTSKGNWFLLRKTFVLEVLKGTDGWSIVEPLTAGEASEFLLHKDLLLHDQIFGEVEEA